MKDSKVRNAMFIFYAIVGFTIGGALLFVPTQFYALNGQYFTHDISFMNDTRAAGGFIFAAGGLIFSGLFFRRMQFTATVIATTLPLAYGLARLVAFALDGLPNTPLIVVAGIELTMGLMAMRVLMKG